METDLTIWTLKNIAAAFSVSSETIKRWAKDGKIPPPDIGEIEGKGKKRWVAFSGTPAIASQLPNVLRSTCGPIFLIPARPNQRWYLLRALDG